MTTHQSIMLKSHSSTGSMPYQMRVSIQDSEYDDFKSCYDPNEEKFEET